MRIARVAAADGIRWVRLDGDSSVPIEDPFDAFAARREPRDAGEAVDGRVLAPVEPLHHILEPDHTRNSM